MKNFKIVVLIVVICVLVFGGCYSFTGSSVPPHLKTVAIPLFEDQSGFGETNLREKFTKKLNDLFVSDNSLEISDRTNANAILEGAIVTISDAPSVISPGEQVITRRVTMTVHASFTDMTQRKKMWEKDFSQWGEYTQGNETRTTALEQAINKVAQDILLETVSGW
mgnify:FL=1